MNTRTILVLVLPWIISVIGLIIFTGKIGLQYQQNIILFIFLLSLYWSMIAFAHHKHVMHLGHWPVSVGSFLLLFGFTFVYGGVISLQSYTAQWWNLNIPQFGIFTLSFVIGVLLVLFGLVQIWRNQYFLMRKR